MKETTYYTNSEEIRELVGRSCPHIEIRPIYQMNPTASIYLFDLTFNPKPAEAWTEEDIVQRRPGWQKDVLPLLKAAQEAYLCSTEWYHMYLNRNGKFIFARVPQPKLKKHNLLLATEPLTLWLGRNVELLFECFSFAKNLERRLQDTSDITTADCHSYEDLCKKLVVMIKKKERDGETKMV